MSALLFKEESYKVIGICMNIHKTPGMGLKEINYKDGMEVNFGECSLT
jgi:tRNA U34 2-thiouridine synthase MnmA/TrmU